MDTYTADQIGNDIRTILRTMTMARVEKRTHYPYTHYLTDRSVELLIGGSSMPEPPVGNSSDYFDGVMHDWRERAHEALFGAAASEWKICLIWNEKDGATSVYLNHPDGVPWTLFGKSVGGLCVFHQLGGIERWKHGVWMHYVHDLAETVRDTLKKRAADEEIRLAAQQDRHRYERFGPVDDAELFNRGDHVIEDHVEEGEESDRIENQSTPTESATSEVDA